MLTQLYENLKRPLIYKIFTWATLAGSPTSRLFSLYSLYTSLSVALKSMFPLFIGSLGQHLIDLIVRMIIILTFYQNIQIVEYQITCKF